jgi:hypothetical protein
MDCRFRSAAGVACGVVSRSFIRSRPARPPTLDCFRYNPPRGGGRRRFTTALKQIVSHGIFDMPLAVPIIHLTGFGEIAAFIELLEDELLCVIVVVVWSATSAPLLSLQLRDGSKPRWRCSVGPILTKPIEPPLRRHPKIANDAVKLFPPGHVWIEPIFRQRGSRETQNLRLASQTQITMPNRRAPLID